MSGRLPALTPDDVIRALQRAGFTLHRVRGSHYHFLHPTDETILVTVPYHRKDLPRGTVRAIIRQVGLTIDQFLALL